MSPDGPALFALGVALLLVANPLYVLPHAGQPEYHHDVEPVAESEVPAEADVLQYADLSAEAKAALRDARTGDGVVYGEANEPPEFFYSDHVGLNQGIYYVQRGDSYYRVMTAAGGGIFPMALFLRWGLVLLGVGIGLVGYGSARSGRSAPALGVGVLGLALLLGVVATGRWDVSGVSLGHLLLGTLAGIAGTMLTVGATARRQLVGRAAGGFALLAVLAGTLWLLPRRVFSPPTGVPDGPMLVAVFTVAAVLVCLGYVGRLGFRRVRQTAT